MPSGQKFCVRADQHILTNLQPAFARKIGSHVYDSACTNTNSHARVCHHVAQNKTSVGIEADAIGQAEHIFASAKSHNGYRGINSAVRTNDVHTSMRKREIRNP